MSKIQGYRGKVVKVKTARSRTTSSNKWLARQLNDHYVAKARIEGYKSRAAFKLIEINEKFHIFKPGMNVIDLGAAPGGWSQIAASAIKSDNINARNKVIAIDLLPMDAMLGVVSVQCDFFSEEAKAKLLELLGPTGMADVVLTDMAANTTGNSTTDHLRIIDLCENALQFSLQVLKPGGHFVAKIFRGGTEGGLLLEVKKHFKTVKHFKPNSSRSESKELYLVALHKK